MVVVMAGLLASAGAGWLANRLERLSAGKQVERMALQMSATISARFGKYRSLLENTRAFITTSGIQYTQAQWATYMETLDLPKNYPGVYELSLVSTPLSISAEKTCNVIAISPTVLVTKWVGSNVCGIPGWTGKFADAAKTGKVVLTGKQSLAGGLGNASLVGLYAAIGRGASGGFVMAHVDVASLMRDVIPPGQPLSVLVFQGGNYDPTRLLYQVGDPTFDYVLYQAPVHVAGSRWFLSVARPYTVGAVPWIAAVVMWVITALLVMIVRHASQVREKAEALARTMSAKYAASEARFAGILRNASDGIFRVREDWGLDYLNDEVARQFGYRGARQMQSQCPKLTFKSVKRAEEVMAMLMDGGSCRQVEAEFVRSDGGVFTGLVSAIRVKGARDAPALFDGAITDITVRKAHEERIRELAYFDPVTHLPNRLHLQESLDRYLAHAKRSEHVTAILFIDLDRFKLVNDTLGHSVGDQLLRSVADRLKTSVRSEDLVARLGGDEFVVIMPHSGSREEITRVADRINHSVGQPYQLGEHETRTSPSIGIAVYPEHGDDRETLLKHADVAMFEAKEAGRNTYRFYSPEMDVTATARVGLESDLTKAVAGKELCVEYQPRAALPQKSFCGLEAKLCWNHPRHGRLEAAAFMPVAAQSDLGVQIGNWQVRLVFAHLAAWRERGLHGMRVSIPVAEVQLRKGGLPELLGALAGSHGIAPADIALVVSASTLATHAVETLTALKSVTDKGFTIELSDFGLDKATLGLLDALPLAGIGLSEKTIEGVPGDRARTVMVEGVLRVATGLGIPVLAKGVATAEQVEFLSGRGCGRMQGPAYAGVGTASEAESFARIQAHGGNKLPAVG